MVSINCYDFKLIGSKTFKLSPYKEYSYEGEMDHKGNACGIGHLFNTRNCFSEYFGTFFGD